jgi:hypothetical protein
MIFITVGATEQHGPHLPLNSEIGAWLMDDHVTMSTAAIKNEFGLCVRVAPLQAKAAGARLRSRAGWTHLSSASAVKDGQNSTFCRFIRIASHRRP